MVKELTEGVGDTTIKCGVIGEIGCSWPLTPAEKKSLLAAAAAQSEGAFQKSELAGRTMAGPVILTKQ